MVYPDKTQKRVNAEIILWVSFAGYNFSRHIPKADRIGYARQKAQNHDSV